MPVVSVTEGQRQDAAFNIIPTYEITFTVPNQPGVFTAEVDQTGDPVAAAQAAISAKTSQVEGIAALS